MPEKQAAAISDAARIAVATAAVTAAVILIVLRVYPRRRDAMPEGMAEQIYRLGRQVGERRAG